MSKLTKRELKKHLKRYSSEALIEDISILFQRFKGVEEYYQMKFSQESDQMLLERYQRSIRHEFFPEKGDGQLRLAHYKLSAIYLKLIRQQKMK